jgi:hypothetical protein
MISPLTGRREARPRREDGSSSRNGSTNAGGFSDQVFELIAVVAAGGAEAGHWLRQIEPVLLAAGVE